MRQLFWLATFRKSLIYIGSLAQSHKRTAAQPHSGTATGRGGGGINFLVMGSDQVVHRGRMNGSLPPRYSYEDYAPKKGN